MALQSETPSHVYGDVDVLAALYADWRELMAATPNLSTRLLRSIFEEWHQPTREPEDVTYKEELVGGVPAIWALPAGADRSKVLLYTHGGGFAVGSAASQRKLAAHFAKACAVTALVIDYR
ncbi:MAG: alpha/beta hydrolase fold domain-containing protein [Mycobacterium sp.]